MVTAAQPALRRRRFAGVVDDERIGDRNAAEQRRREARRRYRDRLARQPFQRSVRAEMNHGVDRFDAAQPEIEGDIGVARRHVRVVIEGPAVEDLPAIGLNRGNQAPEAPVANQKRAFLDSRIVFGAFPMPR